MRHRFLGSSLNHFEILVYYVFHPFHVLCLIVILHPSLLFDKKYWRVNEKLALVT